MFSKRMDPQRAIYIGKFGSRQKGLVNSVTAKMPDSEEQKEKTAKYELSSHENLDC
jgi:hypothetical protein